MPEIGEAARVRAVEAPVANFKQGVKLWTPGDEAEVIWSGFWQGQLERGAIALLEADSDAVVRRSAADGGDVGDSRSSEAVLAEASREHPARGEEAAEAPSGSAPESSVGDDAAGTPAGQAPFWSRWFHRGGELLQGTEEGEHGRDG